MIKRPYISPMAFPLRQRYSNRYGVTGFHLLEQSLGSTFPIAMYLFSSVVDAAPGRHYIGPCSLVVPGHSYEPVPAGDIISPSVRPKLPNVDGPLAIIQDTDELRLQIIRYIPRWC